MHGRMGCGIQGGSKTATPETVVSPWLPLKIRPW